MLSPTAPWQPSSLQAGKLALTLLSVESSTPSSLPALPMWTDARIPARLPMPHPTRFWFDRFPCLFVLPVDDREPVLVVSLQCQPRFRRHQAQCVSTIPCDSSKFRLPPSSNMLDAFMHP